MNESTVNFPVTVVDVALRVNRLGIDSDRGRALISVVFISNGVSRPIVELVLL
jgi:hypothetical protein